MAAERAVRVALGTGRYLDSDEGAEDVEGWSLDAEVLGLLASIPAGIDVDEYLFEPTPGRARRALPDRPFDGWELCRWRRPRRHRRGW